MQTKYQMSESLRLGIFLTLSGGFQDAYSYICRGKVFVNAQTGNIVLLGQNLAEGDYKKAVTYLFPLLSFMGGAYLCQRIKLMSRSKSKLHWRQFVLLTEIFLLFCAGLLPSRYNTLANMTLSFVCAMQVVAFGKFHNNAYATTMCIGNLKSATTLLCHYHITKEAVSGKTSLCYFFIIFVFFLGAVSGAIAARYLHLHSIWIPIIFLIIAFSLMFQEET